MVGLGLLNERVGGSYKVRSTCWALTSHLLSVCCLWGLLPLPAVLLWRAQSFRCFGSGDQVWQREPSGRRLQLLWGSQRSRRSGDAQDFEKIGFFFCFKWCQAFCICTLFGSWVISSDLSTPDVLHGMNLMNNNSAKHSSHCSVLTGSFFNLFFTTLSSIAFCFCFNFRLI